MARTTIRTEDITASAVTAAKIASGAVDTSGLEDDVALLGFKVASNGSLAKYNLVDQTVDDFQDTSGVNASSSTNEARDSSGKYYKGETSTTPTASGGTITTDGDYTIHSFTADGDYVNDSAQTVDYLLVAGGGGGGGTHSGITNASGGGGAGGYRSFTGTSMAAGTFAVVVGQGGTAGPATSGTQGSDGTATTFNSLSAAGGGGAGCSGPSGGTTGRDGGSGGGGGSTSSAGGSGNVPSTSPVQGYDGGTTGGANGSSGGGGASEVGGSAGGYVGMDGGVGLSNSITGSAVTYAGGGGGAIDESGNRGMGGSGGGGNGCHKSGGAPPGIQATDGTVNLGGGGGGAGWNNTSFNSTSGAGGSGVVIIAYDDQYDDLSTVASELTVNGSTGNTTPNTDRSGYKVYKFTAGTGTIKF